MSGKSDWRPHGDRTVECAGIHHRCLLCAAGDLPPYQLGTKYQYARNGNVVGSKEVLETQCPDCGACQWLSMGKKATSTYCKKNDPFWEEPEDKDEPDLDPIIEAFFEEEWDKRL